MKFYVIEIAEGDEKIKGVGAYAYESRDLAIAAFHQKMSTAMKSDLYTREQLLVVDENNVIYRQEVFERKVEPEVTE